MTEETSQPGEEGNIYERLQALREKACGLSETLDGVEKNLQEAERETKD